MNVLNNILIIIHRIAFEKKKMFYNVDIDVLDFSLRIFFLLILSREKIKEEKIEINFTLQDSNS